MKEAKSLEEAIRLSDCIAQVDVGSTVFKRFCQHVERNQPIKYHERHCSEAVGHYDITYAKEGLPGQVNFYLKRIDVIGGLV